MACLQACHQAHAVQHAAAVPCTPQRWHGWEPLPEEVTPASNFGTPSHVQDVACAVLIPLEHWQCLLLRLPLRQPHTVVLCPVHDGRAQCKVGGQLHVAQPHARDGASLVPLRQPPLNALPVIRVPRGQDDRIHLCKWAQQIRQRGEMGTAWGNVQRQRTATPRRAGCWTLFSNFPHTALTMISMDTGQTKDWGMALPSRLCVLGCRCKVEDGTSGGKSGRVSSGHLGTRPSRCRSGRAHHTSLRAFPARLKPGQRAGSAHLPAARPAPLR